MADEIKQVLGIDASQALDALKALDSGYLTFENRIKSVATSLDAFNKTAGKTVAANKQIESSANAAAKALEKLNKLQGKKATVTGGGTSTTTAAARPRSTKLLSGDDAENAMNKLLGLAPKVSQAMNTVGNAAKSNLGAAQKATQQWTVSWETLVRVVTTQLIVRAMSQIRNALRGAVDDAIEFQKQVALITTIADGATFGEIAKGVRAISDNFNIPLLETAKGVYQALSNQVGDFGETLKFTEEAAKFAKATNSSLADSVDLLSAALSSYGLSVDDTAKVSAIFFTAIDKGRVTADQLANSIGRILEPASQIGISLEELSGGIASISERGLGTAETLTQFRGVITALTKPTDAMTAKLRELGFESSKAAIDTLGLDGVLKALKESTSGSAEELAKLFPNVRGLGGALGLTGENLDTFVRNIEEARKNGSAFAKEKFMQATATDAEKLTAAINKVSNAFTLELGNALITAANDLIEAGGGVDSLIADFKAFAQAITFMSGLIKDLEKFTGLVSALGKFSPFSFINSHKEADIKALLKDSEALKKEHQDGTKALAESEAKRLDDLKNSNHEAVKSGREALRTLSAEYFKVVDEASRADDRLVDNTKNTLDKVVDLRSDFLKAIESAIADSSSKIEQSQARIFNIRQGQSNRKFERDTKGFSEAQKVAALTNRAADQAREAEALMQEAFRTGNEALKQRALSQFDRANSTAEQASQIAERTKNRALEGRAAKTVEDIATRQLRVEEQINAQQEQRRQALIKERAEQEKIVAALKDQAAIVVENTGDFNKDGQRFSDKELLEREKRRQAALQKVGQLAFSSKDIKVADFLGLGDFAKSFQNSVAKDPIKLTFEVEQAATAAQAKVQAVFDKKPLIIKQAESVTGKTINNPAEGQAVLSEIESQTIEMEKRKSQQFQLDQQIIQKRLEVERLIGELGKEQGQKSVLDRFTIPSKAIDKAIEKLKQFVSEGKISKDALDQLETELHNTNFGTDTLGAGGFSDEVNLLKAAIDGLRSIQGSQQAQGEIVPVDEAKLQQLKSIFEFLKQASPDTKAQAAQQALGASTQPATTLATQAELTAQAYERAQFALSSMSSETLPDVPTFDPTTIASQGRYLNNPKYMAAGGVMPRGMDTIPVMARAGETIIDPNNSRKFFSQIQAIRAGKNPIFRSEGGSVTNIGDINVNVNGGDSSEATARSIAFKLRREIRRGTSRL